MKIGRFLAAALLGFAANANAAAGNPVAGGAAAVVPSAMLRSALQILRHEQRGSLRANLHADWARMSAAISEEMRAREPGGGPANVTVKSEP